MVGSKEDRHEPEDLLRPLLWVIAADGARTDNEKVDIAVDRALTSSR
jgi:hypothetical protein